MISFAAYTVHFSSSAIFDVVRMYMLLHVFRDVCTHYSYAHIRTHEISGESMGVYRVVFMLTLLQIVLHDVADFNHRKRKVESLKDKLEALVSPKLISAFNSHLLGKHYV